MIIKKIKINGFGKFENKTYELSDGINLIYGENEAGKSTLHKFIEGVFFGFFKPYTKNKLYTDDYKKYLPWKTSAYSGAITYEKDNRLYTAARNFHKDHESVSLHDELTGEDLSRTLEFDIVRKLHKINRDININNVLFQNTVSISQNNSKTAEELSKEIGEVLVNTSQTYSSDISYKKALEFIQNKKNAIGKPTQKKSKMGLCVSKEEELSAEYEQTKAITEKINSGYYEINKLKEELDSLEYKKNQIAKTKTNAENASLVKRLAKYTKAYEEAKEALDIINKNVNLTEEDYERYLACSAYLEEAKKQLAKIKESSMQKSTELKELKEQKDKIAKTLSVSEDNIKEDSLLFKGLILKLKKVKEYNADEKLNTVKNKMSANAKAKKICLICAVVLFVCAIILAAVSYFVKKDFYLPALITALTALAVMGGYLYFYLQDNKISLTYDKFDTLMQKSVKYEIMFNAQLDALKEKYSAQTLQELSEIFAKADSLSDEMNSIEKRINEITAFLYQAKDRKADIIKEAEYKSLIAKTILKQTGASNEEEFRQCIDIMRSKGEAKARYDASTDDMALALGNYTYEDLREKAKEASLNLSESELSAEYDMAKLDEKSEQLTLKCYETSNEIASLEGKVSYMDSQIRSLNVISEELSEVQYQKAEYEKMYAAYERAEEVIMNISKEIHGDFAGIFNSFISQIASKITSGKYTDIKTDDKMNVSVKDNETSKIVSVQSLSGATADQLYFALRLAIAELVLSDKTIPIILDECFIQYDEQRLKNTLTYLDDVAKTRQVIMFSCRKDEKKAMDELNIKYKEVIL